MLFGEDVMLFSFFLFLILVIFMEYIVILRFFRVLVVYVVLVLFFEILFVKIMLIIGIFFFCCFEIILLCNGKDII